MKFIKTVLLSISESSVGTGAGCFPEGAMVYTEKGPRDIATIRRGDKVLSASDDGKTVYSEVGRQHEYHTNLVLFNFTYLSESRDSVSLLLIEYRREKNTVSDVKSFLNKAIVFIPGVDIHRPRSEYNTTVHRSDSRERCDDHDDAVTSAAASGRGRLAGGVRGQCRRWRRAAHERAGRRHAAVQGCENPDGEEARRVRAADEDRHHHRGRCTSVVLRAGPEPLAGARGHGPAPLDGAVERDQRATSRRALVRQRAVLVRGLRATGLVPVSLAVSVVL